MLWRGLLGRLRRNPAVAGFGRIAGSTYVSVTDPALKRLKRKIALVWNPRVSQVRAGAGRLIG